MSKIGKLERRYLFRNHHIGYPLYFLILILHCEIQRVSSQRLVQHQVEQFANSSVRGTGTTQTLVEWCTSMYPNYSIGLVDEQNPRRYLCASLQEHRPCFKLFQVWVKCADLIFYTQLIPAVWIWLHIYIYVRIYIYVCIMRFACICIMCTKQ